MRLYPFAFLLALFVFVAACDVDGEFAETEPVDGDEASLPAEEVIQERVETEDQDFRLVRVLGELENPWAVTWLNDSEVLITERPGRMLRYDGEERREISGLPEINAQNQGGLLDVQLHPEYDQNGWIYFTFSQPQDDGNTSTALARAQLEEDALTDLEILYSQDPPHDPGRHSGSRIAFLDDGTVIFSIGDRGLRDPAQDLNDPTGSVIRVNAEDGSIPDDNPFVDDDNARDEIYSYGHRNIQGMIVQDGTIWSHEHGPRGGDELNIIEAGENYGWPEVTYGTEYRDDSEIGGEYEGRDEFKAPLTHWSPTSIAPSGLAYYDGDHFGGWSGNLFVGALAQQHIRRVVLNGEEVTHEEEILKEEIGRIRDVRQGPDGYLYVLTDESDGGLYRLESVQDEEMTGDDAGRDLEEEPETDDAES